MSDNKIATTAGTALEKTVEYEAFESKEKISLSAQMVINLLCKPTKSGKICSKEQAMRFIMLCKTRGLNPWEGDAFIVGYDTAGGPEFNLITAHQAFLKRAEVNANFEGMDSGVIVKNKDGALIEMPGDFFDDSQILKGAWAKIYLKNRPQHPVYKRIKLESFKKGFGRWVDDPAGMIVKCAEADALRSAFPNTLGGMYLEGEVAHETPVNGLVQGQTGQQPNSAVAALEAKIAEPVESVPAAAVPVTTKLESELAESQKVVEAKKKKAEKAEPKKAPENINVGASGVLEDKNLPTDAEIDGVSGIAAEAVAKVEEEKKVENVEEPKAEVVQPEPEQPKAPADEEGISVRGFKFPKILVEAPGQPKATKAQMDEATGLATKHGISLEKFAMKRLSVDVKDLNQAAMGVLLELLNAVG